MGKKAHRPILKTAGNGDVYLAMQGSTNRNIMVYVSFDIK
jgi:hypothetical protein